ncbi:MAG: stage III sporulation AC/AD family protein [Clostridia bacterium]|nr:stage III sporulation AC/AD family protein [Clostridia bacterium]
MTALIALSAFALVTVFLLKSVGELSPKFRILICAGAAVIFFRSILSFLSPLYSTFTSLSEKTAFAPYLSLLLKGAGLGLLTEVSASFCRELGEEGVAGKLEAVGKAAILALSLPLVGEIARLVGELTE